MNMINENRGYSLSIDPRKDERVYFSSKKEMQEYINAETPSTKEAARKYYKSIGKDERAEALDALTKARRSFAKAYGYKMVSKGAWKKIIESNNNAS